MRDTNLELTERIEQRCTESDERADRLVADAVGKASAELSAELAAVRTGFDTLRDEANETLVGFKDHVDSEVRNPPCTNLAVTAASALGISCTGGGRGQSDGRER
eukprot:SAG31_NODE_2086_length_6484_cov_23.518716_4_plen_105_part_00